MPDDSTGRSIPNVLRRRFLASAASGAVVGLAGCQGQTGDGDTTTTTADTTTTTGDTTDGTETTETTNQPKQGGTFTLGAAGGPETLNLLVGTSSYIWHIIDAIYDQGVVYDYSKGKFVPWAFSDWELQGADTDSPTIVATLRDDMSWHDGESLTAEDVVFTIEYIREKKPKGITADTFASVETVEATGEYEVTYNLNQKDAAWLDMILAAYIIPKHIWEDVDQPNQYSPRENDGPIGSGAFVLNDYNWNNWLELKTRENVHETYKLPQDSDVLHDDAPFIDTLRYEIYGSSTSLTQAVFNGDVDMPSGGVSVDNAVQAKQNGQLEVLQTGNSGYPYIGFNLRRIPFDDTAFRQFLTVTWNDSYYVDDLMKGIGAIAGDYPAPYIYDEYRPKSPEEAEKFRFSPNVGDGDGNIDVDAARSFLLDNSNQKHEFSFQEAVTDLTNAPDGKELYVNGQPVTEAHTNNTGEANQGSLVFKMGVPKEYPTVSKAHLRWVNDLQKVGIPVEQSPESFSSRLNVFFDEQFDIYSLSWSGLKAQLFYLWECLGSGARDLDGETDAFKQNAVGYTGADELLDESKRTMDPQERKELIHQALGKIYEECPVNCYAYDKILQPAGTDWNGHVVFPGGATNRFSWLNLRKS